MIAKTLEMALQPDRRHGSGRLPGGPRRPSTLSAARLFSFRRDNFRVLAIPPTSPSSPSASLYRILKDVIEPWCQYSIFRSIRTIS